MVWLHLSSLHNDMQNRSLTLIVPVLPHELSTQMKSKANTPNLRLLFRRAQREDNFAPDLISNLFKLFSLKTNSSPAIAPISGLADGLATSSGYWLRADPIELQADLAAIYMMGSEHLQLNTHELAAIQQLLQPLLQLDNLELFMPSSTRWYLKLVENPQITSWPPQHLIGKNIYSYQPTGNKQAYWQKLATEIQMLLYNSEINQQRQQRQQAVVNGIWLWGGGALPPAPITNWQYVWTNDILVQGLSCLAQVNYAALPNDYFSCQPYLQNGNYLLVLSPLQDEFELLESNWLAPIIRSLRTRELTDFSCYWGERIIYRITASQLRRFWQFPFKLT